MEPFESGDPSRVIAFIEAGYDGTNLYYLEQTDPQKLAAVAQPALGRAQGFVEARGSIKYGASPPMDVSLIFVAWLAFASDNYFAMVTNAIAVAPVFVLDDRLPEVLMPVTWRKADQAPFLGEATWTCDGSYTAVGSDGAPKMKRYSPPYSDGFRQAQFRTLTWTNWGEIVVPMSFQLNVFSPGNGRSRSNLNIAYSVTGNVSSIGAPIGFSAAPTLASRTFIHDTRFNWHDSAVTYVTHKWLVDPQEAAAFLARSAAAPQAIPGRGGAVSTVVIATMVVSALAFVFFFVTLKKHQKDI